MSPRLPKYPKFSIRPRIDHDRLANEDVDKLRRRIRYPPTSKTYKESERLEAVRYCLDNRVRGIKSMAVFAYCVARDPRMSRYMRDFANKSIRKSKAYIREKMKILKADRKYYKGLFEEARNHRLAAERNGRMTRAEVVHDLTVLSQQYDQSASMGEDLLMEWDPFTYGPPAFGSALTEEMRRLAIVQGLYKSRLPNDIKRRVVFQEANLHERFSTNNTNVEMSSPSLVSSSTSNNGSSGSNTNRSGRSRSRSNGNRRS